MDTCCIVYIYLSPPNPVYLSISICRFLAEVSTYAETSKMTLDNLAIVFAPIMLRSSTAYGATDQMAVLTELNTCKLIVKMLIVDELNGCSSSVTGSGGATPTGTTGTTTTSDDIALMMNTININTNTSNSASNSADTSTGSSPISSPHSSSSSMGRVRLNLNTRERRANKNTNSTGSTGSAPVTVSQADAL